MEPFAPSESAHNIIHHIAFKKTPVWLAFSQYSSCSHNTFSLLKKQNTRVHTFTGLEHWTDIFLDCTHDTLV